MTDLLGGEQVRRRAGIQSAGYDWSSTLLRVDPTDA